MAAALTAAGLTWLWLAGHEVEVVGAVLAALLVAGADAACRDLVEWAARLRPAPRDRETEVSVHGSA